LEKRLDPRTYEEMGVDQKARIRIPTAAYARERKGEITPTGLILAQHQWDTNKKSVELIAQADHSYEQYRNVWLRLHVQPQLRRSTSEAWTARRAARKIRDLAHQKVDMVIERNALSHVAAKLESRARLKAEKKRDEADRAAIDIASEMNAEVRSIDERIALLVSQILKNEKAYAKAKKIDDLAIKQAFMERLTISLKRSARALMAAADEYMAKDPAMNTSAEPSEEELEALRDKRHAFLLESIKQTFKLSDAQRQVLRKIRREHQSK
jgi:hypothetical protein